MAQFDVLRARSSDTRRLAELNAHVQSLHVRQRPDFFKPADLTEVAAWFSSLLARAYVDVWLAEHSGVGLGYILVLRQERGDNPFCLPRRWHEIDQLSVAPDARRQGVARALIQKALGEAAADGVTDIEVSSWAFNTEAHATFLACGFQARMLRFEAAAASAG
jgi:GNAT superfamily N-acetyltransferase